MERKLGRKDGETAEEVNKYPSTERKNTTKLNCIICCCEFIEIGNKYCVYGKKFSRDLRAGKYMNESFG